MGEAAKPVLLSCCQLWKLPEVSYEMLGFSASTCLVSSPWFSCGVAVSMGEAGKHLLFECVQAGCHVVLRGRRGTLWHSNLFDNVSKKVKIGGSLVRNAGFSASTCLVSSFFPVASPCLWGKLENISYSNVSKQVVMSFCVAGVALCDIPTCLITCPKYQNWRKSRTKCSFFGTHVSYTPHSSPETLHSTLHTLRYTLHFPLLTPHSTLYTPHSTLYTLHSTLLTPHFTVHSTLHTLYFTLLTPHSTLYTPHSTLYTLHSTLSTLHSSLHTLHSTLYTPHSTLYTPHSSLHTLLYTPHFILYTPHFTLHTLHSSLHTLHSSLYTPHSTLCTPHSTLHTLHFTLHTLHSTLYTLHSILHTLHFTLRILHFTHSTLPTPHFTLHTPYFTLHTLHFPLHTADWQQGKHVQDCSNKRLQKGIVRHCITMCFDIRTINIRVSIRVRGLHLVFTCGYGTDEYWSGPWMDEYIEFACVIAFEPIVRSGDWAQRGFPIDLV